MRVLVVDDEFDVRQLVCTVLEHNGHHVVTASDGREALELAGNFVCDLVITDFAMPGMNGGQLIALLQQRQYPARYLLISGTCPEQMDSDLPILPKPFTAAELQEAVASVINGRRLHRAMRPF